VWNLFLVTLLAAKIWKICEPYGNFSLTPYTGYWKIPNLTC